MAVATTTPMGYGHVYAPEHYVEAWLAVTGASGWTPDALAGLKRHLADAARAAMDGEGSQEDAFDNRGG